MHTNKHNADIHKTYMKAYIEESSKPQTPQIQRQLQRQTDYTSKTKTTSKTNEHIYKAHGCTKRTIIFALHNCKRRNRFRLQVRHSAVRLKAPTSCKQVYTRTIHPRYCIRKSCIRKITVSNLKIQCSGLHSGLVAQLDKKKMHSLIRHVRFLIRSRGCMYTHSHSPNRSSARHESPKKSGFYEPITT